MYVVSTKQIVIAMAVVIMVITSLIWFTLALFVRLDLPEVYVDETGQCLKVVNYRNGDGFICQDRDVILRKYTVVKP